jgi:hypothetical protein
MTPLGNLQNEADLRRWLQQQLATPGILPSPKPDVSLVKNGVPADSDFPKTPGDGTLALDSSGPTLYCRVAGVWSAV